MYRQQATSWRQSLAAGILILGASCLLCDAVLVQPYNYMLDDSSLVDQQNQDAASLSPFFSDQSGAAEHNADKDIISIIGDGLAKMRLAKMLNEAAASPEEVHMGHYSPEMAELIKSEQQQAQKEQSEPSLSSSVANMLLNVAQAASQASADEGQSSASEQNSQTGEADSAASSASGHTSAAAAAAAASKSEMKVGPVQWFNPKETIPVLKISSMATPSKYKKVYFRSEKKLVDGAFHSPSSEQDEKKSLMKPFSSGVQRRSSRGTSPSGVPPGLLQDGVIEFLRKFRDVYVQTRPAGAANSATSNLASVMSAAASSPLAAVLAPPSSSRPSMLSVALAAMPSVGAASGSTAGKGSSGVANAAASAASAATAAVAAAPGSSSALSPIRSPLSAQSYVSFWSKTFPTWVRRMLKQMRRRSLYNNQKRKQQHQSTLGQAAQAAATSAVANVVESAVSGSNSGSSSSSSSSSAAA